MYLLDTNTLIYFFKGIGRVSERLLSVPPQQIKIPAIVVYELEVGLNKSKAPQKRQTQLNHFLSSVEIFGFGPAEAKAAAQIRSALEKVGTPIGPIDTLIAGTALAHRATLVSHNTREFSRIKQLQLEDWY